MKALFINYWGIQEGLTQGTSLPHLRILMAMPEVDHLWFASLERDQWPGIVDLGPNTTHLPIRTAHGLRAKWNDFTAIPKQLAKLAQTEGIDWIICRGAPTGAIGHLIWKRTGIPYSVESFEPHAEYMLESGVWSKLDPRYGVARYFEARQKQSAFALMPVAEGYRQQLIKEGVPAQKVITQPCAVPNAHFWFQAENRQKVRQQLGYPDNAVVGIYAGKFGDMYLTEEAFALFKACFGHFGTNFWLVLLSPNPPEQIQSLIDAYSLPVEHIWYGLVSHEEVPGYLHAADFGFAPYKPSPAKRFLSPIKVGEYWAAGLPVVITRGIGDETDIIEVQGGGCFFDPHHPEDPTLFECLQAQLALTKATPMELAKQHRSLQRSEEAYRVAMRLGGFIQS